MEKRFVALAFPYLETDWYTKLTPDIRHKPVVVCASSHGRMVILSHNLPAQEQGIHKQMVLADARAIIPSIQVINHDPLLSPRLLNNMAEWCIRFTPVTAVDLPDGIILDVSGCAHLWGGEKQYLQNILDKLSEKGYFVRAAMADTIGAAWGIARFAPQPMIIPPNQQLNAIKKLPPAALRIDEEADIRLQKLGLRKIRDFINMPSSVLRRRFGHFFIQRINQALGLEEEHISPVCPVPVYSERLPSLEPISTATGIHIALERLIETLCTRLKNEQKGLRSAVFKCFRVDNKVQQVEIGTNRPSASMSHILKLFEEKISDIEPGPGIELFMLDAPKVEEHLPVQDKLWENSGALSDERLSEFTDKLSVRIGKDCIKRFIPDAHYWPERSFKQANDLADVSTVEWKIDKPRPVHLLTSPERIQVTAPIPDYPPMMFRYNGRLHKIIRADGPERIEQEWWIQEGEHRDYYNVEDEDGNRYWLFRSGHYEVSRPAQWFIHGFFA